MALTEVFHFWSFSESTTFFANSGSCIFFFFVTLNLANFVKMEKMGNDINGVNKTSKSILDRTLFLFLKHYNSPKGSFSLSVKFFWIFFREFEIMHFFLGHSKFSEFRQNGKEMASMVWTKFRNQFSTGNLFCTLDQ